MLQKLEVYSSSKGVTDIFFSDTAPIEEDFVQVLNVDGLDPVTATIDSVASDNVDGAVAMNASVPTRNIVLTLRPNADYQSFTPEGLRQPIYAYFVPKSEVKLVFTSSDIDGPVEIMGIVESCQANPFTKDPTYLVSIVCADPYFTRVDALTASGSVISPDSFETSKSTIHLYGNVPIGVELKMIDGYTSEIYVQMGNPAVGTFHLIGSVDGIFYMGSIPTKKYVRSASPTNGTFLNRLNELQLGSTWPVLSPGANDFAVMGGASLGNAWELIYYPKYAGL